MIGLGDKDIPDPELHGAELVVVDKAEKVAYIKRMDETNSYLTNSQNSLHPRVGVVHRDQSNHDKTYSADWIRIFVLVSRALSLAFVD